MNSDFLLNSATGKVLYEFVRDVPVIDYHNHLSLEDIRKDKRFFDVSDLWIKPDPYKHRAMRMCGVEERYITGNESNKEKFIKWCETIPKLIGNPLFHWSLMELDTIFGITEMPDEKNAERLYFLCNKYLEENNVTVNSLLEKFNTELVCPCASLVDDIIMFENNKRLAPSLRGDDIVNLTIDFIKKLSDLTNVEITDLDSFKCAVRISLDFFAKCDCRFSDHAIDNGFEFYEDDEQNDIRFKDLLEKKLKKTEQKKLFSYILVFLGEEYSKRNFVMQLHIGAERYTSTRLRNSVGAAGGFAGIGNSVNVRSLTRFLDVLDMNEHRLPKTMLFTLNPADNALISVLSGSYSRDNVAGLITQGAAWWWCDHMYGILEMLENTSVFGVLSNFVGMTTDSRSLLSFVRHDYFRRILCNWIGKKAENGEFCCDISLLKNLVYKLCYENAKKCV